MARTADIARELGRAQNSLSQAREYLLENGIVYSPRRGQLIFLVPYLADYLLRDKPEEETPSMAELWKM